MKRFALALLLCALCLPFLLTGCGEKENAPCTHEHVSDWIYDKEATCQKQGIRHKECLDCGKVVKTESYHVGHQYEDGVCRFCGRPKYDEQYMRYRPYTVGDVEGYIINDLGDCKSTKLNIPETHNDKPVLAIADRAFQGRTELTYVFIPKTVVSIGEAAFRNCTALEAVTFAAGSECAVIGDYAFCDCTALTRFEVPQNVTRLADGLFCGDAALEELLLHDGITAVGTETFEACTALLTTQKNGMAYLGNGENRYFLLLDVIDKTAVTLAPEPGLKIVGAYAFAGCRELTALTLPDGVTSLSDHAVSGCTALQNVQLPTSLAVIGDYAFAGCSALSHVDLPQNLFGIGNCAFSDCAALTSVTLPASLCALGSAVFRDAAVALTERGGLLYIGSAGNPYFALVGATDKTMTELMPHPEVKLIAGSALADCTALTSVTLPGGMIGIGTAAFSGCGALVSVEAPGTARVSERLEDTPVYILLDSPAEWAAALTGTYLYRYWFLR